MGWESPRYPLAAAALVVVLAAGCSKNASPPATSPSPLSTITGGVGAPAPVSGPATAAPQASAANAQQQQENADLQQAENDIAQLEQELSSVDSNLSKNPGTEGDVTP